MREPKKITRGARFEQSDRAGLQIQVVPTSENDNLAVMDVRIGFAAKKSQIGRGVRLRSLLTTPSTGQASGG